MRSTILATKKISNLSTRGFSKVSYHYKDIYIYKTNRNDFIYNFKQIFH